MKVHVVTGFLGSGKTTFLLNFVPRMARGERILILVNEFSQLGIDGPILSRGGLSTIELPHGCICCTLAVGLLQTLEKARFELAADRVLIEPTGIAVPSQIHTLLSQPPADGWCEVGPYIGMVDAGRYRQMATGLYVFWNDQVETSDVLLLNKIDKVTAAEREAITADLSARNPTARIFPTLYGVLPESEWDGILAGRHCRPAERRHAHLTPEQKRVECWDFSSSEPLPRARVEAWLAAMNAGRFGDALRAKGDVFDEQGGRHLDWVPGDVHWTEPVGQETRLVVVGRDLDRNGLAQALAGG
ncbi:GTP-binding protein [bacterium]|nr:GTP-binding protein [bacterium]